MTRRTRWRASALLVTGALIAGTALVSASTSADDEARLSAGFWTGVATARGTAAAESMGFDVSGFLRIKGDLEFAVGAGSGQVAGRWVFDAPALMNIVGSQGGLDLDLLADVSFSGAGPMAGGPRQVDLGGTFRTQGSIMGQPIDNTGPMPPLRLRVVTSTCDEVYGEWTFSIEGALEGANWSSAEVDGSWFAIRDHSAGTEPDIDGLLDSVSAQDGGESDELALSGSPLFDDAADLLLEFQDFTETFDDWALGDMLGLLADAEALLLELRSGSECDRSYLGDGVEQFDTFLTFIVQELISFVADTEDISATTWQRLANIAVRTGAVSAGSPDPERAAMARDSLIGYAERELNARLDAAGVLESSDDVIRIVGTSAMMGWDLTIGGTTAPAIDIWAELPGN